MRPFKITSHWNGSKWEIFFDGELMAADPDLNTAKALAWKRWRAGWKGHGEQ